jgi:hypothetical protein
VSIRPQTRVDRFLSSPLGGLSQPVEWRLVGAHLIGAAMVKKRDQDIGEHVAGEQDATICEKDRGVANGLCLMLDDLARHGFAVRAFLELTSEASA